MQKCEKNAVRTQSKVFIKNKTLWRVFCIVEFALIRLTEFAEKVFMHYRKKTAFFNAASLISEPFRAADKYLILKSK